MYSSSNEYILEIIKLCNLCVSGEEPYSESLKNMRMHERGVEGFPTMLTLQNIFGFSECEIFCVMLVLGCELDGGLRNRMNEICGLPLPSFDVVFSIWSRENNILPGECVAYAYPESSLSLFILENSGYSGVAIGTPLRLRENIVHYLTTGQISSTRFYWFFQFHEALPLHQPAFIRLRVFAKAVLESKEGGYICLRGKVGTGRRSLAARVAAEFGLRLMIVSMNDIPQEKDACRRLSCELAADTVLAHTALYVDNYSVEDEKNLQRLLAYLPKWGILLFVSAENESSQPYLDGRPPFTEDIGALSSDELRFAAEKMSPKPLPDKFPSHLRLSVSELAQVMQNVRMRADANGADSFTSEDFTASSRQISERVSNTQTLDNGITLDDIILAPETRKKLDLFCQFIRKSEPVREQWGFSRIQSYGKGVVGLFCGASGTGKTMAANAISNALGLRLMRIDISKIFDKYIGETEKRLSQLFKEADSQNCILFFDEADALFSKRTEVSSSHDRYANVETSFLLQCIEEFNGVTILSTNLFQNFDEAFMRRITVIARFSMPDEKLRYEMWKRFFPQQTPLAEDVDLEALAKELELSPAIIKAAAFTAAILASEDGGIVAMRHIVEALKNEMCKWGKESIMKEFEISLR